MTRLRGGAASSVDRYAPAFYTGRMANTTGSKNTTPGRSSRRQRREPEPVDLRLSFTVRTGDEEDDVITIMDERELKMVGSVFQYRDQAARFLAMTLVKVAATNRKVFRQVVPGLKGIMNTRRDR